MVVAVNQVHPDNSLSKSRNSDTHVQPSENIMESRNFEERPMVNSTLEKRKLIVTSKIAEAFNKHQRKQLQGTGKKE